MPSRRGVRLAAALVPAVALVLPAAAHAEKVVTEDSVGDARAWNSAQYASSPAPDEASADITRTVVAHGNRRLIITIHFRDLSLARDNLTVVRVHTPQKKIRIGVSKKPGSRAQTVTYGRVWALDCRALRATVDGGADQVTISVPTACIDAPRWVQLELRSISEPVDRTEEDEGELGSSGYYGDDGYRDNTIRNGSGRAKGPRVHRGPTEARGVARMRSPAGQVRFGVAWIHAML